MSSVFAPPLAAAIAATMPAHPPPTTATSNVPVTGTVRFSTTAFPSIAIWLSRPLMTFSPIFPLDESRATAGVRPSPFRFDQLPLGSPSSW